MKKRKAKRASDIPATQPEMPSGPVRNPFKALGLRPDHIDYHPNNPADRIYAWYMGGQDEELSPNDEWYHHVFKTAHAAQIQGYTDSQVAKILAKCFGISDRLAYKYLHAAQSLFGTVAVSEKNAMRHMLTQMAKSCYRRAFREGDYKAALLALREIKSINGLDAADAFVPDPGEMGGNTYVMQVVVAGQDGARPVTIDLGDMDESQRLALARVVDEMEQAPESEIKRMIDDADAG